VNWKYKVKQLAKTTGPYSHIPWFAKSLDYNSSKKTKWWHYGEDKGGIQISSGANLNPSPSDPSSNSQT
jgi:hypothetical protein